MPTRTSPVDIADRSTWPPELAERVRELAEELVGSTDSTSDLALEQHDEEFRTLLEGHLVRAYHCTRLLEHEAADIRAHGLRILTPELVAARLDAAREHGHITAAEHAELSKNHHFARPFTKPMFFGTTAVDGRSGRIYLALPATVFDINGYAFDHLLSCWAARRSTGATPMIGPASAAGCAASAHRRSSPRYWTSPTPDNTTPRPRSRVCLSVPSSASPTPMAA